MPPASPLVEVSFMLGGHCYGGEFCSICWVNREGEYWPLLFFMNLNRLSIL